MAATKGSAVRKNDHLEVNGKLAKVKTMSTSKTGKHGGAKVSLRCKNVMNGKNIIHVVGSQDSVDVLHVHVSSEYQLVEIPDREGSAILQNDSGECIVVRPEKDELDMLQRALELDQDPLLSVVEWRGEHKLLRIASRKR